EYRCGLPRHCAFSLLDVGIYRFFCLRRYWSLTKPSRNWCNKSSVVDIIFFSNISSSISAIHSHSQELHMRLPAYSLIVLLSSLMLASCGEAPVATAPPLPQVTVSPPLVKPILDWDN